MIRVEAASYPKLLFFSQIEGFRVVDKNSKSLSHGGQAQGAVDHQWHHDDSRRDPKLRVSQCQWSTKSLRGPGRRPTPSKSKNASDWKPRVRCPASNASTRVLEQKSLDW
eukprot:1672776-Rhodomonas_salina.1